MTAAPGSGITNFVRKVAEGVGAPGRARVHLVSLALLLLAVLAAFGPSLHHGFVWDDNVLIVENDSVRSPGTWSAAFLRSFWSIGETADADLRSFYRPIISLSYMADFAMWGLDPRGFHIVNLFMHWLVCVLVYGLALRFLRKPLPALTAAVLFAVHPVHVENVCWISGRTDLFCAFFLFLSFGLFLSGAEPERARPLRLAGSALCFALALLSKETGLVLPILVIAYVAVMGRGRIPAARFGWFLAVLVAISVAYLAVRKGVLGEITGPLAWGGGTGWAASVCMVFAKYLGLLLLLVPTDPHHAGGVVALMTVKGVGFVVVALAYAGLLAWLYRRRESLLLFLLAWIPLALLPVFNLGTFGDILYADRFLYVPSFGFALAFSALALRTAAGEARTTAAAKAAAVILYGGVILAMTLVSRSTASRWASDRALFEYAAQTSPDSPYVLANFGNSLAREKQFEQACRAYETAISFRPDYVPALFGLGHVLKEQGRYPEATATLLHALRMNERKAGASAYDPDGLLSGEAVNSARETKERGGGGRTNRSCLLCFELGDVYRKQGNLSLAKIYYRRSLAIWETSEPHSNLGEILLSEGDLQGAHEHFRAALALDPSPVTFSNLGLVLGRLARYDEAIVCLTQGLRFSPDVLTPNIEAAIRYSLAKACSMVGQAEAARRHAARGLRLIGQGFGPPGAARELSSLMGDTDKPRSPEFVSP